ncbi:MAG: hypothetical protein PHI83_08035 [Sphaerochaetaceae bacterium]|nr:hypothetical protein [Sphaerochaetaceae bacterium]
MKTSGIILHWLPRLLAILFICFLALFSLDVLESEGSAMEIAGGLLMHNIPSIILLVLLIIAWKREYAGAICFFCAGVVYIIINTVGVIISHSPWHLLITRSLIVTVPSFAIGALFLLSWKAKEGMKDISKGEKLD